MPEPKDAFTEVIAALNDRQRTIFFLRCIRALLDAKSYDSPLFGPKEIEPFIQKLVAININDFSQFESIPCPDLEAAERQQAKFIDDEEESDKEWLTGKMRFHDDAWIPAANLARMRDARIMIRWLITARRNNWLSPNVPSEIEGVFAGKGVKWLQRFTTLSTAVSTSA